MGAATDAGAASPLDAALRRCGARMVTRWGRSVAAHFGSAASEAAVILSSVGIADRSERPTLELRGAATDLDGALEALEAAACGWSVRVSPVRALVRCEAAEEAACHAVVERSGGDCVLQPIAGYAVIAAIGPRAQQLVELIDWDGSLVVLCEGPGCYELLVAAADGPALWTRLLEVGARLNVACVGQDALDRLAASGRLAHRRTS